MAVRGARRLSETQGSCMFSYMLHKNARDRSDQKSGKWSKVREKSVKSQGIL